MCPLSGGSHDALECDGDGVRRVGEGRDCSSARSQAVRRRGLHRENQEVHYRAGIHVAAGGLLAGLEKCSHAGSGVGRRSGCAGNSSLRRRRLQIYAPARKGQPARESFLYRQDRRRPRDDRRGHLFPREPEKSRSQSRATRQARRSAHHKNGRRRSRPHRGQAVPVYYITGTIHSPETGAPTALMELAYRLAVDESPYIREVRDGMITLITPVVEVDGRDRMVDIYKWHLAHPKDFYPPLMYWGKYVGHDNNRDAMGVTLKLTENVLNTYVGWKAQVLHDLHESVPYLYDNTVGDGPYNAWIDPILADEWQMISARNVADMTKFGMPGVFAHGDFDTWSPGYLMFIAAMHNGISRLYETFGNGGADTRERTLEPDEYSRTWYRANPPLPKALWSQRDNNNYEETGLLTSLHYFNENKRLFLKNFYLKSKRSIQKPSAEGPAAYVLPANDPRRSVQADLLRVMLRQHVEISRATTAFEVTLPAKKEKKNATGEAAEEKNKASQPTTRDFPAGSYVIKMDQPYSRVADALLDYQYWSPDDPQKTPYDDTGWTFGELFGVQVARVTDPQVLTVSTERVAELPRSGGVAGDGTLFAINNHAEPALATLRYLLKSASIEAAEEPFQVAAQKFTRGTFLIKGVSRADLDAATRNLDLHAVALSAAPAVLTHPVRAARIALLHTWSS